MGIGLVEVQRSEVEQFVLSKIKNEKTAYSIVLSAFFQLIHAANNV
jgi:hypothetical protein